MSDLSTGQKKLIVDEAIVPSRPIFDHSVTYAAPGELTQPARNRVLGTFPSSTWHTG